MSPYLSSYFEFFTTLFERLTTIFLVAPVLDLELVYLSSPSLALSPSCPLPGRDTTLTVTVFVTTPHALAVCVPTNVSVSPGFNTPSSLAQSSSLEPDLAE